MLKVSRWRLFWSLLAIGAAIFVALTNPIRLGIDLRGGTQVVLEAQDTPEITVDSDVTNRTLEVIRRRVDAFGVAEPTLQTSGDRRIIVELPGVDDPDQALELIGRTAQLTFHPVVASLAAGETPEEVPEGGMVLEGEPGEQLVLGPTAVTGDQVETATGVFDSVGTGRWVVSIQFRPQGEEAWVDLTAEAACAPLGDPQRRIAIVLDQRVLSSPGVSTSVPCDVGITGGATQVTGNFDEAEAQELALLIRAGALPVPVEVIDRSTIGPSLGESAVEASLQAALIGAALTILYLSFYYRVMGVVAALALLTYGLLSYATLVAMGATLTLPGLAGFILAIGMAVDANVLVYERSKEEYARKPKLGEAIRAGFERAWTAIADANMTTLLAAVLLFFFATGAVRGFGITLSVGVVVSMFSALVVTRVILEILTHIQALHDRPKLMGLTVGARLQNWLKGTGANLFRRPWRWIAISAVAVVLALSGLLVQGINYGLEFLGGRLLEFSVTQQVDLDELRSDLVDIGLPRALIQETGTGNVVIRTEELDDSEQAAVEQAVARLGGDTAIVRDQFIGPTLGSEIRNKALVALGLALLMQMAYLAFRFRWTVGLAAIISMFHDVALLIGVFVWLGRTLDGVFLAAILTVIGYSINDSVVIFDRIREERANRPNDDYDLIASDACLHTVPRTINTGLGAMLILVALYLLGGDTLGDFALALLIGILVGTYSSVFTASPLAVIFEERWPTPPPDPEVLKRKAAREKQRKAAGYRRIFDQ